MDRRSFLGATAAALSVGAAGCVGDGFPLRAPNAGDGQLLEADCGELSRPEPDAPTAGEAIQPVDYPGPPPTPLEETAALEYVSAFERAYRRNLEIQSASPYLIEYGLSETDRAVEERGTDGYLVRLEYVFHGTIADGPASDSAPTRVSYALDPGLVVRAGADTSDGPDEDWPEVSTAGTAVACFERTESG
ncbi:MAG: hypothetical protein ACLFNC_00665 [Halodesulfurarchaeum sp.]